MPKIDRVLIDTGPLVAILSASDAHHQRCIDELKRHRNAFLTCWPVLAEAGWLLRREPTGVKRLFQLIEAGVVEVAELDSKAAPWVMRFLEQFESVQADVADAALMYLAEREGIQRAFTIDRRDFGVYRLSDGRALEIIP